MKTERCHVLVCVEKGFLEQQGKLLIKSISVLADSNCSIHIYSPRSDYIPHGLASDGVMSNSCVTWHKESLNSEFLDYPIANKLLACNDFEKNNKVSIIFSDTDTVFLNDIRSGVDLDKPALFLRPVDNKGPGSEGLDDPNDAFWQDVFKLCGVPLPKPSVWTTVRPKLIRPYFNAGFIWAHMLDGFFQQWYDDFIRIVESDLRPFGWTSRDGDDFRCLDQVALAVTATRFQEYLQILPETYNYPIPFRPMMKDREGHPAFKDLVHVHYHKWFQHPGFLDHVTSDEDKQSEQYKWLKEHLPLQPEIDGPFKC